jgi:hypothetical protein
MNKRTKMEEDVDIGDVGAEDSLLEEAAEPAEEQEQQEQWMKPSKNMLGIADDWEDPFPS